MLELANFQFVNTVIDIYCCRCKHFLGGKVSLYSQAPYQENIVLKMLTICLLSSSQPSVISAQQSSLLSWLSCADSCAFSPTAAQSWLHSRQSPLNTVMFLFPLLCSMASTDIVSSFATATLQHSTEILQQCQYREVQPLPTLHFCNWRIWHCI